MDSWKFEIHWTWSELHWFDCSITGVFSGRTGIGRFSWALQDPARNHPPGREPHGSPRRAYLSFSYFCRARFVLAVLHVDDGSYWSTMVFVILSMLVYRDVNTPRFRPWVTVTGKSPMVVKISGQPSSSEMDDLHSLSSAACFLAWSSRASWSAWVSWSAWMSGLDFPVRGLSL